MKKKSLSMAALALFLANLAVPARAEAAPDNAKEKNPRQARRKNRRTFN